MKIYIIFCVPAQTTKLGKKFLRYEAKYSQPIRLQNFLIDHIFQNESVKLPHFLHIDTNSCRLKFDKS